MERIVVGMVILLVLLAGYSCDKVDQELPNQDQPEAIVDTPIDTITELVTPKASEIVAYSNDFGIKLFTRLANEDEGNMMISPLSASAALTMLLNGCGGETYAQIAQMLGYPPNIDINVVNSLYMSHVEQLLGADPKVALAIANAVFHRNNFHANPTYLSTLSENFKAQVKGLDFSSPSAVDTINQWASDNTNGKIDNVIQLIPPDAVMYLLNALYFKGDWTFQFHDSLTYDRPFYLNSQTPVPVSTMGGNLEVKWHLGEDFVAVELPYGGRDFSMVVIVPYRSIQDFTNSFTTDVWNGITSSLDSRNSWSECNIYMPKFRIEYEKLLTDYLRTMGMVDAFCSSNANLSGISQEQKLYVSMVKQNTFIEVNERGTEAAAVTLVEIEITGMTDPSEFHINKPFVFAIRERTSNTLLFIGRVMNPKY